MGIDVAEGVEAKDGLLRWAGSVLLALREDGEEDILIGWHTQSLGHSATSGTPHHARSSQWEILRKSRTLSLLNTCAQSWM